MGQGLAFCRHARPNTGSQSGKGGVGMAKTATEQVKEDEFEEELVKEVASDKKKRGEIREITDLPGIGDTAAEKLNAAGYNSLEAMAIASPTELIEVAGLGELTASKAIKAARDALEMGFETADKLAEKRKTIGRYNKIQRPDGIGYIQWLKASIHRPGINVGKNFFYCS